MARRYATIEEVTGATGVAPELEGIASAETYLEIARSFIGLARFGDNASHAHALLTAHLLSLSPDGPGPDGPVASASVGPVSTSLATTAPSSSDASLASTRHGRLYLEFRALALATGSAVVSSRVIRYG